MIDLDELKEKNPIGGVIAEQTGYELVKVGRYLEPKKGTKEGGLRVLPDNRAYYWEARGRGGDVISFLQNEMQMPWPDAINYLAERAGIPLTHLNPQQVAAWRHRRTKEDILACAQKFLAQALFSTPAALDYAHGRGWSDELLTEAGCGYWSGNRKALAEQFALHGLDPKDDLCQAILGMPGNLFIYAHRASYASFNYLTGRKLEGKFHYNLPRDAAGPKQPYWNHLYSSKTRHLTVVEGQADALSFAAWGLAAVAIAGASPADTLVSELKQLCEAGAGAVYIALDTDNAGQSASVDLADALGPTCKIVTWPEGIKDANEWLQAGATSEQARALLGEAPLYAEYAAATAPGAGLNRDKATEKAVSLIAGLPDVTYQLKRANLAKQMGIGVRDLDSGIKAAKAAKQPAKRRDKAVKHMVGGYLDGHLFETVLDESDPLNPCTRFAVKSPNGQIEVKTHLEFDHVDIFPPPADREEIAKRALLLAPPPQPFDNEQALLAQLRGFIHRYVDLSTQFEQVSAFYALYTWIHDIPSLEKVPYLRRLGDYGGGKSRWLKVMWVLSFRSFYGVNPSPAAVFRLADSYSGTLCLDEFDLPDARSEQAKNMLDLINAGYSKDLTVPRAAPTNDDPARMIFYDVFGPKLFAQRRIWGDEAADSRCLTDEVSAGGYLRRQDVPIGIDQVSFWEEVGPLRAQLLQYRLTKWQPHIDLSPGLNHAELPGRLREIILPLLTLFDDAGLREDLDKMANAIHEQTLTTRATTMPAKIMQGLLIAYYLPNKEAQELPPHLHLAVKFITQATNALIDTENRDAAGKGGAQGEPAPALDDDSKKLKDQTVGPRIRKELGLATRKDRWTYVVFDEERIDALCKRFGLEAYREELKARAEKQAAQGELKL